MLAIQGKMLLKTIINSKQLDDINGRLGNGILMSYHTVKYYLMLSLGCLNKNPKKRGQHPQLRLDNVSRCLDVGVSESPLYSSTTKAPGPYRFFSVPGVTDTAYPTLNLLKLAMKLVHKFMHIAYSIFPRIYTIAMKKSKFGKLGLSMCSFFEVASRAVPSNHLRLNFQMCLDLKYLV